MTRLVPLLSLTTLAACGSGASFAATPRPVQGVPEAFVVDTTFHRGARTAPAGACLTHLVDPRDGTTLVLAQAQAGVGDFDVSPPGRYGLGPKERLRVDCATGSALGAVGR